MKFRPLLILLVCAVATSVFAGSAHATNDGHIFFRTADTSDANGGKGIYRIGCDGSDPTRLVADTNALDTTGTALAMIGGTLYIQSGGALYKVPNAATAAAGQTPTQVTMASGTIPNSTADWVATDGTDLYSSIYHSTGVARLVRFSGLGGSPTVQAFSYDPAATGWDRAGIAFAGTTKRLFVRPATFGSTVALQRTSTTGYAADNVVLQAVSSTGAPAETNAKDIAGHGAYVYTLPGGDDYGWMARYDADADGSWTPQWARLFHNPTYQDNNPLYGTNRLIGTPVAAAGGVYMVGGYGTGGSNLLAAYDATSGGFAYIADLEQAFNATFDYVYGVAVSGTCTVDTTAIKPSIKSYAEDDAPSVTQPAFVGSTLTVSNGSWAGPVSSYEYEWQQATLATGENCNYPSLTYSSIAGTTSSTTTWTPQAADAMTCLRVKITPKNGSVTGFRAYTSPQMIISGGGGGGGGGGGPIVQPTTRAKLSGGTVVGCTLTLTPPVFAVPALAPPTIRWSRYDGPPGPNTPRTTITSNAGSLTYTLTTADVGGYIEAMYSVPLTTGTGFSGLANGPVAASGSCDAAPTPGPAVKTSVVPKEIVIEIPASPAAAPIAKVPCEAVDGERLQSCTVDMTAPLAALLGQGDGVIVQQARRAKTFVAGSATVTAKSGRKRIVVPVKVNAKGRKALARNVRLKVTVGITTVTLADATSSGSAETEMRLPRQVLSPQDGIFDTLSTQLNADGRAFVRRLAALLPATPKAIVCTGYADSTGVPGDNRWLGERRAIALCDALAARGVKAKRTRIVSKGALAPRDDNATAEGRARNRRASITITY